MNKMIFALLTWLVTLSVFSADEVSNVKFVNFIQDGDVSKLIIEFDKPTFGERTHIKDDKQIILDVKNAVAGKKFLRGMDTSEFSGSAVFVSPYKKPGSKNDLRFAIQLRDNVRSFIENKRNRIILHIENRFGVFSKRKLEKADVQVTGALSEEDKKLNIPKSGTIQDILENLTLSGVKKYIGKKISINVISVSYPEVLRMIADTSGFNIIIDDEINGLPPLTLSLTNIPWDEALDTIMSLGKLVAKKHSNILTVQTETKARQEKQLEIERKNLNKIQEPMVTKIFPISFAKPDEIVVIIGDYLSGGGGAATAPPAGGFAEQQGRARVDQRTSNIIVRDTVEVIERIKKIIEVLDTETPQILIESKIVEVQDEYELRAGLGGTSGLTADYDPISDLNNLGDESGVFSFSSAPTAGAPTVLRGAIQVYKRLTGLNFALDLMESETKGRIVSSPKIITQNNEAATITSDQVISVLTQQQPLAGGQAGGAVGGAAPIGPLTTLESLTASLSLAVTPRVTNDGSINMRVEITKGSFGNQPDPSQPPPQTNNSMTTNVLVDNGSTIVVGGIHTTSEREVVNGIPFLKDLPLIGWLFRNAYNPRSNKAELVVFITPRIINQEEAGLVNRDSEGLGI